MDVWLMVAGTAGIIGAGAWGVARAFSTSIGDIDRLRALRLEVELRKAARLERLREIAAKNPLMKQSATPTG
ncbi:MAG: hypothetical protein DYG92_00280 [Leptolyngbya sp. PLA1]|nr:hypothetical protein [Leptolyngbya sp. PLA1]